MGRLLDSRNTHGAGKESLLRLLNVESVRMQTLQEALSGAQNAGPANQPVPLQIPWHSRPVVLDERPVELEPIAAHVPEECFYLRLGSFDNYLWLRELLEENGGDIGRMVTARGHDAGLNERLQDQLGLKESVMAKLLGGQVIADVALIGRDTYLSEGAAIGILFEARNGLLQNDLMRQRREAVTRWESEGAEMTTVEISGREVSLAFTPDNRLRSFYASDGKYHLVTTSLEIVTRFLEVGQGAGSLRDSPEFQVARQTLPLDRDDTVFVYLSPAFFRGLMSPQYQIELRRRMQSIADIEILQMAKWAARVEQQDESLDQLVRSGLVPRGFMDGRPDGSRPVPEAGSWIDSLRGARGTFLPIPDVPIESVTAAEAAAYQQVAAFHRTQWDHMDPLIVALKRFSLENDRERLRIEARMLPFDSQKYGMVTSQVGPPSQMQLTGPPEDIVNIQLVLKGGLLRPAVEPHLLFFGMRDADVPLDFGRSSLLRTLAILRTAPAYLGAWPKLGLLDLLPLGTQPDAYGFSQLPFGLWRQQTPSGFSVLSFDPQILESTVPQLGIERSDHHAQARVRIGDISAAQIRPWFNTLNYQRAYETSVSNTRLLHAMSQQLGVPPAQAKEVAESLLGVKLMCTLGGEYELRGERDGLEHWVSTRWPGVAEATDDPYTSPLLKWFRGLEADAVMHRDRVIAYAQIDMQRQPKPAAAGLKLPSFNLFRDNPFKRPEEKLPEPAEEEPFEELPPPRPEPPKRP